MRGGIVLRLDERSLALSEQDRPVLARVVLLDRLDALIPRRKYSRAIARDAGAFVERSVDDALILIYRRWRTIVGRTSVGSGTTAFAAVGRLEIVLHDERVDSFDEFVVLHLRVAEQRIFVVPMT